MSKLLAIWGVNSPSIPVKLAIDELAAEGKIFSNERQFQLELVMKLKYKGFDVELEVVSSDKSFDEFQKLSKEDREKLYTDKGNLESSKNYERARFNETYRR